MNTPSSFLAGGLFAAMVIAGAASPVQAETLDAVLARMDQAAKTTKAISADFTRTEFLAVFGDSDKASGKMNLRRDGSETKGVIAFSSPDVYSMHFPGGGKAEKLLPAAKLLEVYDLGKRGGMIDEYLLLGFANPVADLRKDYDIAFGGEETLGGRKTTRIELTPKNKEIREEFVAKIQLWIPEGGSNAVQVKLIKPSSRATADYYLFEYSNVVINPDVPDSVYRLQVPSGVKRQEIKL